MPSADTIDTARPRTRPGLVLFAMCLAVLVAQIDTSVVNLGAHAIGDALGLGVSALQWVLDVYNLVYATLLLTGGLLGDLVGRRRIFAVGVALFALGSLACGLAPLANAVPVLPGAIGHGITTPAGRGGKVIRVTNTNADGAGSLKACVDASGPRVCVFEVSGTITLPDDLTFRNRYITVAGQTAPSPGITLRGAGVLVKTSDVLIQHIRVRPGDAAGGEPPSNRDALKIEAPSTAPISNVVIDHCTFTWSVDEIASAWQYWNNISLLNNIFAEPLHDSIHPEGKHGFGVLIGPVDGNATMAGNLFANMQSRNPMTAATRTVIVNNLVYNWGNTAIDLQSRGDVTQNSVVGNVFLRGPDTTGSYAPIGLRADSSKLQPAPRCSCPITSRRA